MAAPAPPSWLSRRQRLALWLMVAAWLACCASYLAFGRLVGERVVLPTTYLMSAVRLCGPDLGVRTWLYQGLTHETQSCEAPYCGSGMRALCDATREGRRISHDVLTR